MSKQQKSKEEIQALREAQKRLTWIDNVKRKLGYSQEEAEKKWTEINSQAEYKKVTSMDYKILINKNAVPVLIEASNNADPDTWFALEDESHHIRFKEEPTEVLKDIFGLMNFAPQSLVSAELENQRGQTFPLPTGYKVSFEELSVGDVRNERRFEKFAILSKLEEESKEENDKTKTHYVDDLTKVDWTKVKQGDTIYRKANLEGSIVAPAAPSEEVKRKKDLFNDKVEIPAWTLIEIQRGFKALKDDKESYLHNVFSDDHVFDAINIWNKIYNDYFNETGGFLK